MYYHGPMMDGYDWGWGGLMMVLWLIFFVVLAVFAVRALRGHSFGNSHISDPLDIIKERYAKGEISKEQFEEMKKDLSK